MKARIFAPLFIAIISATSAFSQIEVTVTADGVDRTAAPVSAVINAPDANGNTPVSVEDAQGNLSPGQIERLEDGTVKVWWITGKLEAGKPVTYKIHVGKESGGKLFRWRDEPDRMMDLLHGGRPVLTYMYTPFDPNNIEDTKKPYHQVYDPDGRRLITKGLGGLFPHHRGIFFGYNKCIVDGKSYDIWHARNGEHSVQKKVVDILSGPVVGGHTVRIDWNDTEGKPFIQETRTLKAYIQPKDELLIEFDSTLESVRGAITLDGDRQHAGAQFRASQYVAEHQENTRYLRPEAWKDLDPAKEYNGDEHKDLPWNAVQFPIEERQYTVAYISHPSNPDEAGFSERRYARFGEFFKYELTEEKPLAVHYRFWINADGDVTRATVESKYQDYANPPKVMVKN